MQRVFGLESASAILPHAWRWYTFRLPKLVSFPLPSLRGAGEPLEILDMETRRRVDPRVCGGAKGGMDENAHHRGRSPRVRGSLPVRNLPQIKRGSIPACAGEPVRPTDPDRSERVDPRVCGGAHVEIALDGTIGGRSPRVRGSLRRSVFIHNCRRSIPACAGEPRSAHLINSAVKVDPRVCGGALRVFLVGGSASGRSPRVRGSLSSMI